ncbi:hypothetical protein HS7_14710 [Sulfolobales archaeon HS-7]|nr:hypothetical protein HS7_14710 [Sulfolobales archaeon HS-7]
MKPLHDDRGGKEFPRTSPVEFHKRARVIREVFKVFKKPLEELEWRLSLLAGYIPNALHGRVWKHCMDSFMIEGPFGKG